MRYSHRNVFSVHFLMLSRPFCRINWAGSGWFLLNPDWLNERITESPFFYSALLLLYTIMITFVYYIYYVESRVCVTTAEASNHVCCVHYPCSGSVFCVNRSQSKSEQASKRGYAKSIDWKMMIYDRLFYISHGTHTDAHRRKSTNTSCKCV